MSKLWSKKFGFPCLREAINPYNFSHSGYHGSSGDLLLYLDCKRKGNFYHWTFVNLTTGVKHTLSCGGWDPHAYLAVCSVPLVEG